MFIYLPSIYIALLLIIDISHWRYDILSWRFHICFILFFFLLYKEVYMYINRKIQKMRKKDQIDTRLSH